MVIKRVLSVRMLNQQDRITNNLVLAVCQHFNDACCHGNLPGPSSCAIDAAAEEVWPGRAVSKALVRTMSCLPGETVVATCPVANYGWVAFSK